MYTAEISSRNKGLIVLAIDTSSSMADPWGTDTTKTLAEGTSDACNKIGQNLLIKASGKDRVDICVFHYGMTVGPYFSHQDIAEKNVVSIMEFGRCGKAETRTQLIPDGAGGVIEKQVPFTTWFESTANGWTPMVECMTKLKDVIADWIEQHPESYPPIVINVTDGEPSDGDPIPITEEIKNLETKDGKTLVYNCHISSRSGNPIVFPPTSEGLDSFGQMLYEMSSILPESVVKAAAETKLKIVEGSRGFAFNADLVTLIQLLDIGTRMGGKMR